jgi:hypothetical protein
LGIDDTALISPPQSPDLHTSSSGYPVTYKGKERQEAASSSLLLNN